MPKIKPHYKNWPFFDWMAEFADATEPVSTDGTFDGNWQRLIDATESDEEKATLKRYEGFIYAACEMARRLTEFSEVEKIALIGSLARPPYREKSRYRRRSWEFHQPHDVDLAVWVSSLENLATIRRVRSELARKVAVKKAPGVCENNIELFLFDSTTSKYLGCVCYFGKCPRGNEACAAEGCGVPKHLKTMDGFRFHTAALSEMHCQILFKRHPDAASPHANLFADLPKSLPAELTEVLATTGHARIERIISTGHASPPDFWYDQAEHEWVLLLHGYATLEFQHKTHTLFPGDYVFIHAHQKHCVASTSPDEPTVWLAVFIRGE